MLSYSRPVASCSHIPFDIMDGVGWLVVVFNGPLRQYLYPRFEKVGGGYTGLHLSVVPSILPSVLP